MHNVNRLLLASMAIAMVGGPQAFAAPPTHRPFLLAQAADQVPEAVAAAQANVDAARAALDEATAAGTGIKEARAALRAAIKQLNEARVAAGLPPVIERPLGSAERPQPADRPPPAAAKAPPVPDAAPPAAEVKAPSPPETAPAPAARMKKPLPPTDQVEVPAPPPAVAIGKPPTFDPSLLKKPHPRFGAAAKDAGVAPLPKQEAQIPQGGAIDAGAGRTIVKEDNGQVTVRHDDTERFRQLGGSATVQQGPGGTTTTVINRPGGVQIVTVRDSSGNILQRYRKDGRGQIAVLIGQAEPPTNDNRRPPPPPKATFDFHIQLPPLKLTIPQNQYVVESSRATRQQLTRTFEAPPVERVERPYSLEEIRRSDRIRNKVRRVDFDTVTFEFGSAVLPDDQIPQMQAVGEAMQTVLQRDPGQVFLIEGYTDAVGSDLANLALSDRRAETVAEILTYYFNVPPENLVTQGYGEQFLKVPTNGPERANRRVAFRNITSLMRVGAR